MAFSPMSFKFPEGFQNVFTRHANSPFDLTIGAESNIEMMQDITYFLVGGKLLGQRGSIRHASQCNTSKRDPENQGKQTTQVIY